MKPVIAVIAAGAMGGAVGARLAEAGAEVLTSLAGRSDASRARADAARMADADDARIAGAEMILSIVPPAEALALAERLAPALAASDRKPLYLDCNAVSPQTVRRIAEAVRPTGCGFVDAGIIGGPPRPGTPGPVFCVSGADAARAEPLAGLGLRVRRIEGEVGAASALKMCYGGINKGIAALGAAMVLGAARNGAGAALHAELADSQPDLLRRYGFQLPDMYPKAYRWVAEMREIADFLGPEDGAAMMFEGAARLFERLAADAAGPGREIAAIDAFLGKDKEQAERRGEPTPSRG